MLVDIRNDLQERYEANKMIALKKLGVRSFEELVNSATEIAIEDVEMELEGDKVMKRKLIEDLVELIELAYWEDRGECTGKFDNKKACKACEDYDFCKKLKMLKTRLMVGGYYEILN